MFASAGTFTVVYCSLAVILVLLVLFEKPLIALEDEVKAKRRNKAR